MSNPDLTADLESQHRQLLLSLRLPDTVVQRGAPDFLKHFDMGFARQLLGNDEPWGREDAFAERSQLIRDVLTASQEARQLYLAAEIDLLRKVQESGEDVVHKGPFDLLEAVFPVKVRGHLVHLVRSGKYRAAPFTAKDLKDLAFLSGRPLTTVEAATAAIPVCSKELADAWLNTHRQRRDAIALALKEHVKARALTGQQVQSERLIALGTMADGMAHHFSNLLSVILGYGSLVLDQGQLDPESTEALRKINEAAQRGRRFTAEVLALTGSQDEEETRQPLHERLDGALTLLQARLPAGARIERDFKATRDVVLAPAGVLQQIVFNLLAAAVGGLARGGVLTVRTSNVTEEQPLGRQECVRIEVSEGETAPAKPGRITSARSALDTMAGEAVGPTLTSLFGLIGRLDGSVTVESRDEGQASRIEVTLPLAGEATAEPEKKFRRRLAPSEVWVVDDDVNVGELCRRVLTTEGHTVTELPSGEALVHRLQRGDKKPDLLVIDFNLPDQNGLELILWLREAGHRIPVVFTTGLGPDHPQVARALKQRKAFLLSKPFTFRDLADRVTIALGETLIGA